VKLWRLVPPMGKIINRHNTDPFHLQGDPSKTVIFFPGLTKFARDADVIAKILHSTENANFFAENLPGQESFATFSRTRAWMMLRKAEALVIKRHKEVGHPVVLMGVSTGALIAGIIAARHPEKVRAVVLISAARTLHRKAQRGIWFGLTMQWILWPTCWWWSNYWSIPAGSIADDPDKEQAEGRPYHTRIPMWTGSSILYLQILFGFSLSKMMCPVQQVWSKSDDIIAKGVAEEILKDLQKVRTEEERDSVCLAHAPHVPTVTEMLETSEREILEISLQRFLRRVWSRPLRPMYPEERLFLRIKKWFRRSLRRVPKSA